VAAAESRHRLHGDTGAAVAEFVMVAVLLILLLFGVLQVAVLFYVRNIAAASAADAARFAATSNLAPEVGGARATAEIQHALSAQLGRDLHCVGSTGIDASSRLPTTVVRCTGDIESIFLPVGAFVHIDVTARALTEAAPP
jgi:Flp pilus assembly protein TadG